jgi:hypothetical protein
VPKTYGEGTRTPRSHQAPALHSLVSELQECGPVPDMAGRSARACARRAARMLAAMSSTRNNLSLQRSASLKGLSSRRKQREDDREHVAEKLQRRLPKFNQFSQNGIFSRDRFKWTTGLRARGDECPSLLFARNYSRDQPALRELTHQYLRGQPAACTWEGQFARGLTCASVPFVIAKPTTIPNSESCSLARHPWPASALRIA